MTELAPVKGNQQNIRYISESFRRGMLSHAYIIDGTAGSGKEAFAERIAAALLCEKAEPGKDLFAAAPCGKCSSCIKAASKNHPDIIHITHEKDSVLSVKEIREQLVFDMAIKPYYGPYKIYIVRDAQLMNENAQNALLKTIEEPAGYGLVLLLTDNADGFLQTIRSRCIRLNMEPLSREEITRDLLEEDGLRILEILNRAASMNALEINKAAKELEDFEKNQILEIWKLWFRDVLVYKSTKEQERLYFKSQFPALKEMADKISFEAVNRMLLAADEAASRIKASVKAEAVYENFLLCIRREIK